MGRETVFPPWARLPTRAAPPDLASEAEAHLIVDPGASHTPSCSATGSRLKTDNGVQSKSAARAGQKRSPSGSAPGQARGGVGAEGLWCCELTPPRSSLCPSTKAGPLVGDETTGLGTQRGIFYAVQ